MSLPHDYIGATDRPRAVFRRAYAAVGRRWWSVASLAGAAVVLLGLSVRSPDRFGVLVVFLGVGCVLVFVGLRDPVWAVFFLLIATFTRLALPDILPVDPFLVAFAGVIASVAIGISARTISTPALGPVEAVMALYVLWNIASMVALHTYQATVPTTGEGISVWRFVLNGTVIPFVLYFAGRSVFVTEASVRRLLWLVLALSGYSAAVSIMQFRGPTALVWPRYIVDSPAWDSRAVGIFNQPVVNGLILIVGFVVAMFLAAQKGDPPWRRVVVVAVAFGSAYGIYLSHTRVVWLAFALVLVGGAACAKGFRSGFVIGLVVSVILVATHWATFTSSDRAAGGVGSEDELHDRLNMIGTSLWAAHEKPWSGWGIARFAAVNTYHHSQWSDDVPWERGFGIASHLNELGILVELGLVGLALWLTVLGLVLLRLIRSYRILPADGFCSSRLGFVALTAFLVLIVTGLTVDLRFFDFPNAVVMLLAGVTIGWARRHTDDVDAVAAKDRNEEAVRT